MSTYEKIHGRSIQAVTTDPTGDVAEGQVWYNTTSDTFKSIINLEAWNSETPVTTSRQYMQTTGGPSTSSVFFGGYHPGDSSPNTGSVRTEEWNGLGFETGGDSSSKRYSQGGAITSQTAALMFGGYPGPPGGSNATESYNGTSWTTVNTLPNSPSGNMGGGIATSALNVGGNSGSTYYNASAEWDGSNWTAGGNIPQATSQGACVSVGVPNAFLFGGKTGPGTSQTSTSITYDGTSWTAANSLPQATQNLGGAGPGSSAAIAFGGSTSSSNQITTTHTWNGTNWSTSPATLGTGNEGGHSAGNTGTSALAVSGGSSPSAATTAVQNYSSSVNIITAAAWAAGGNYPSSVQGMGVAGTQTATVSAGGAGPTNLACTYDGSSWTTITNYPLSQRDITGTGVQTAGFMISGYSGPPPSAGGRTKTNYWNGSSWVAGGDLNNGTNRQLGGSAGILTAALYWGGDGGTPITAFESYNGSAWTALTAAPFGGNSSGCGTDTAALATPGPSVNSYEWGGSSWTAGGNMPVANQYANLTGTQTDAIHYGGYVGSSYYAGAIAYDGTTWSTRPSMATARGIIGHGTAGTSTSALATAGYAGPGGQNATEEFTGETTAVNVKTLTQS